MLPSQKRLPRKEFIEISKNTSTKSVFNSIGTLKYRPYTKGKASLVVSSKVEKRAVGRNKLKRRIYTLFKKYIDQKDIAYILYVSKEVKELNFKGLAEKLDELIKKTTT